MTNPIQAFDDSIRTLKVLQQCSTVVVNPLTTDDATWHCPTLAACYQLVQFVLKIGFALAKKAG